VAGADFREKRRPERFSIEEMDGLAATWIAHLAEPWPPSPGPSKGIVAAIPMALRIVIFSFARAPRMRRASWPQECCLAWPSALRASASSAGGYGGGGQSTRNYLERQPRSV